MTRKVKRIQLAKRVEMKNGYLQPEILDVAIYKTAPTKKMSAKIPMMSRIKRTDSDMNCPFTKMNANMANAEALRQLVTQESDSERKFLKEAHVLTSPTFKIN